MKNSSLFAFIAGTALGAALGLLLAPDKGENTQKKLTDEAKKFQGDFNQQWEIGKEKFQNYTAKLKSNGMKNQEEEAVTPSEKTKGTMKDA